jgi:hypothetical protein
MNELNDSAVVRRIGSNKTHVAELSEVRVAHFIKPYWAPAYRAISAACGVEIPTPSVIMATGTKVRCRTCVHLTGITEQSPAIHEKLGEPGA